MVGLSDMVQDFLDGLGITVDEATAQFILLLIIGVIVTATALWLYVYISKKQRIKLGAHPLQQLPPKERNLWTGVLLIMAMMLIPVIWGMAIPVIPEAIFELAYLLYLFSLITLMIIFLMYTKPVAPAAYKKRRAEFFKLFAVLLGYLVVGLVGIFLLSTYQEGYYIVTGVGGRLFDIWILGAIILGFVVLIWYLIVMWHRNPAAIFAPSPLFLLRKNPKKKREKRMKKKLGREC